jgi:beta-lactamase regulating signal transducer with metallopeptidase domain
MIEQINHIAQLWWSGTAAMFWQVSILIVLIGCVDLIIRKWAWPQLRYALWLMVLVKLVLPPTISLSTSVTSGLQPLARQVVAQENRRENLKPATARILTNFENTLAESPAETAFSDDAFTERQPAVVSTSSENVAGQSLNTSHVSLVWQVYAMAVWLAGMFILGGWLVLKLLYLRKEDYRLATTASLPESFYDAIVRCAKNLGLRRVPKVVLTRKVACPAVFGVIRPVLLMPAGYLSKMTRRDTEHMLLHELAHIKRGDLWVHGFYMLLQVVYWYNPLLWLVRNQMHHLRELCCDATVARLLKERIGEYRQTLIDVARRFLAKPTEPGLGLLGLFEDSNRLLVRLNWLKKETWRYQKMKKLTVITTIVLMIAFVLPMAQAQNPQAEDTASSEQLQIEKDNSDSTMATMPVKPLNQAPQLSNPASEETEGTAQLDVTVSLTVRGKKIDNHHARVRLLDAIDRHEVQRIEKGENGRYLFTGIPPGKYIVEAYFWDSYPTEFENVTLAKGEEKSILVDSKTEQLARIRVAGKLLDKRTGKGIEGATIHFVGAPDDDAITYPDGSFATHADRSRFHQILVGLGDKALSGNQHIDIQMNNHINEDLAANLEIHIDPEHLSGQRKLRDEDGDGIFCDGIDCVVCPAERQQNRQQLSQALQALQAQLRQLQIEKLKLETELQVMTRARQAEAQAAQAKIKAKEAALKAKDAALKANKEKDKDGESVATREMQFVAKVKPGIPFIVRNSLGNINLKPSKDDTCDVRAVIRAKAKTAAEAQEMAEQVSMNVESSNERYYLKPVKKDDDKWNDINVDFYIAVPVSVRLDVKTDLGNIDLSDLKGDIKAVTNLGSVKAVNTSGNVNLRTDLGKVEFIAPKDMAGGDVKLVTNLGDIEFTAPRDLSAKFQVQTKMGEIKSELPLQISKPDMFKRTTEGTIGSGQANINMTTEMGKINLKWQSSSQVELDL